ncbi:hypothetical protein AVEN_206422-1 [Araneus ventricosus]|uniref:Uncharacterized protein n=1 Tax=Araneus ventricosus TaxID=182803 RepID=A0A4Y2I9Q6_ARAVE|nr:hypothetical protein AVEN_206422-1 [Araneus ventricosus]
MTRGTNWCPFAKNEVLVCEASTPYTETSQFNINLSYRQNGPQTVEGLAECSLEGGGGLITAGESSKSSDMLYSKASSSDAQEEIISASASDSRDCNILFSNGGRTAIGKSSMSTEVGLVVSKRFNAD